MNTARCPLQSGDEGAILLSYLDRRLDYDSMEALDRHVSACPDCARVVQAQRTVWKALDQWEPVAVSADFDERLMRRIEAEQPPLWRRMLAPVGHWWKPAVPLAAACGVLIAVSVWREPSAPAELPLMDSAEAQQMEDALSDLEMLRKLGLTEAAPAGAAQTL
jgi:hypothetical protein